MSSDATYRPNNRRINDSLTLNEEKKDITRPFTIVVGADPQFGLIASYIEKRSDEDWDKEIVLFNKCVHKINQLTPKPEFFIMVGDLCNAPPTDEHYELRKRQEKDFFSIVDSLDDDIPLLAVSGNHDVGDVPTTKTIDRYRRSFGPDYYSFIVGGVHFIVINSQYYVDSTQCSTLAQEQEKWLDEQLANAKGSPLGPVIFMHTPLFVSSSDEPDTYFSLVKSQREKLLDKFLDAGVKYVFSGHLHKNAGGKYKDLEVITTTAIGGQLGPDKSGFRLVAIHEDKLVHTLIEIEE